MGKKDQSASIVRLIILLTLSGVSLVLEILRAVCTSFVRDTGFEQRF
jgi:hypothetical protein